MPRPCRENVQLGASNRTSAVLTRGLLHAGGFSEVAHQRGAAVVVALFIVVLCTLSVSPLIWTLFATAKSVSVSAAREQTSEVVISSVDWARVILREDARVSATDNLTEPWAVPLAESRLSEGLMRREENVSNLTDREAVVSGQIEDSQGRFNLRNLGMDVASRDLWLASFDRLCDLLGISQSQKSLLVETLATMYPKIKGSGIETEVSTPGLQSQPAAPVIAARTWTEFKDQYGISEETWTQLRPHVAILPQSTRVNVNTAGPEVIYAVMEGMSYADAQGLINYRERVTFNNLNDLSPVLNGNTEVRSDLIGVTSDFFFVTGQARIEEALIRTRALLERRSRRVYVVWRED